MTNYVFPNLSIFGGVDLQYGPGGYSVHWHVPIDDESHWRFEYFYHPKQPFDKAELRAKVERELTPDFLPIRNPANRYLQDRGAMKRGSYAGMGDYFPAQDVFVVQSQGSIQDRTQENLGTTDVVIAAARRMLFDAIEGLDRGADPPFVLRDPSENMFNDLVVLSDELDGEQDPSDYCAALARSGDYHAIPTEAT